MKPAPILLRSHLSNVPFFDASPDPGNSHHPMLSMTSPHLLGQPLRASMWRCWLRHRSCQMDRREFVDLGEDSEVITRTFATKAVQHCTAKKRRRFKN